MLASFGCIVQYLGQIEISQTCAGALPGVVSIVRTVHPGLAGTSAHCHVAGVIGWGHTGGLMPLQKSGVVWAVWAGWAYRHFLPRIAAIQDLHVQARQAGTERVVCCVAGGALYLGAHSLPAGI